MRCNLGIERPVSQPLIEAGPVDKFHREIRTTFDVTRKAVEKALGKPLTKCDTGDDMRSCELEIAPQRTVMLMAEDKPGATHALVGCYYFYEK